MRQFRQKYPCKSKLKVLRSASGYYIGTLYMHSEDEYEPYERVSTYFNDKETAELALVENKYVEINL